MIQLIEKHNGIFRLLIEGEPYTFAPPALYRANDLLPLPAKVKASTLGWHTRRRFVSYNQLRAAIRQANGKDFKKSK